MTASDLTRKLEVASNGALEDTLTHFMRPLLLIIEELGYLALA